MYLHERDHESQNWLVVELPPWTWRLWAKYKCTGWFCVSGHSPANEIGTHGRTSYHGGKLHLLSAGIDLPPAMQMHRRYSVAMQSLFSLPHGCCNILSESLLQDPCLILCWNLLASTPYCGLTWHSVLMNMHIYKSMRSKACSPLDEIPNNDLACRVRWRLKKILFLS